MIGSSSYPCLISRFGKTSGTLMNVSVLPLRLIDDFDLEVEFQVVEDRDKPSYRPRYSNQN